MAATAISVQLRLHRPCRLLLLQNPMSSRYFSSSSSNSDDPHQTEPPQPESQPQQPSSSSFSYILRDLKSSLKQTQPSSQSQRPPLMPPNHITGKSPTPEAKSLDEIRNNLSEFRRSTPAQRSSSSPPTISLEELYPRKVMPQGQTGSSSESLPKTVLLSLSTIRSSLKNLQPQKPEAPGMKLGFEDLRQSLNLRTKSLSGKGKNEGATKFMRIYTVGELGEKLKNLRPEVKGNKKNWFSLEELEERLKKVRENEEKEIESRGGINYYNGLRESFHSMHSSNQEKSKKNDGIAFHL